MSRLSKLRLVTSLPHLYKKLEEFGVDHDYKIKEMVKNDTEWFASQKVAESSTLNILDNNVKQSPGFKITIDNVDYQWFSTNPSLFIFWDIKMKLTETINSALT